MRSRALLAFQRDIAHASLSALLKARLPLARPLHRYVGTLTLEDDCVLFAGDDTMGGEPLRIRFCYTDIEELQLGYDGTFKRIKDKYLGIGLKPLRIRGKGKEGETKTVYIFANFNRILRKSQNKKWLDAIKRRI